MPVIPEVISTRYHVNAEIEYFLRRLLIDPFSIDKILTVRNTAIDAVLLQITFEKRFGEFESGCADNITDEQDI